MADLFEGTTPPSSIDPEKNYLEELVGENRKFKSVEDLAKGKAQSDLFIDQLRQELEQTKQELQTRARLEELITKVTPQAPLDSGPILHNQTEVNPPVMSGLTPEQLEELLEKKLNEHNLKTTKQTNFNYVKEELTKKYGPQTPQVLEKAAGDLGVSKEWMNQMAAENPKAFMRLVGDAQATRPQASPDLFTSRPTVNSGATFTPESGVRDQAWYQNLKRTDPKKYDSPEIQAQEYKDAVKLGPAFFTS